MTRVLAVADSDSYLKWTAATLDTLPADWQHDLVLVTSPITPSAAQALAAARRLVPRVSLLALLRRVHRDRPDVLLLGCTGPVVQAVLIAPTLRRGAHRPVLVTGLPGISIPATSRALELRSACDLFLLHSHRERADFFELGRTLAPGLQLGLARLPFLVPEAASSRATRPGTDVVFAAQAKVPPELDQREAVLLALAQVAPTGSAVVKLRAVAGEEQTHRERWPYARLWAWLVAEGRVSPGTVRFSGGAMAAALADARGLVTVSSTAALEAVAAGLPILVLTDFGVSAEMINTVFAGSGCLGTLADLRAGRFRAPDDRWRRDNYFHPAADDDWLLRLDELLRQRDGHGLPPRSLSRVGSRRALLRRHLRLLLPRPWWVRIGRAHRRLRRLRAAPARLLVRRAAQPGPGQPGPGQPGPGQPEPGGTGR